MKNRDQKGTLRRARRQGGNVMVESGMILLPMMALILAFIDHGLAIFLQSTFQHAVREGARYAITYQVKAGMGHDASIQSVVKTNAMGFLSKCTGCIKIRYYRPDTLAETAGNLPGNLVEVSVEGYRYSWIAPLWRPAGSLAINARASDRMEGLPGGQPAPTR